MCVMLILVVELLQPAQLGNDQLLIGVSSMLYKCIVYTSADFKHVVIHLCLLVLKGSLLVALATATLWQPHHALSTADNQTCYLCVPCMT